MRKLWLLLLFPMSIHAQAINYTEHVDSPMNEVIISDCSESVVVSGFVHGVIHLTRSDKEQSIMVETHVGPRGDMRAVGLDTGNQYKLVGDTTTRLFFSQNILEGFSYHNTFKVVGLFTVHYTYHLLLGDNYDTPKAFTDNLRVECK